MKIAFVTPGDPEDRMSWSGTHFFALNALREHFSDIQVIGISEPLDARVDRLRRQVVRRVTGESWVSSHTMTRARAYSRSAQRQLDPAAKVLIAIGASDCVAALPAGIPVLLVSDATFRLMINYYEGYSRLSTRAVIEGESVEAAAFGRSAVCMFASDWAAQSAQRDYGVPATRTVVNPLGANLMSPPPALHAHRPPGDGQFRALLVGRRWQDKGGDIAVDAIRRLRDAGIAATLTVCGMVPPEGAAPDWVRVVPLLDKNTADGEAALIALYQSHDVLLAPSRAECYGLVLCEAASAGLPVVAAATGGIPTVVHDGANGFLVPPGEGAGGFADRMRRLHADTGLHARMCEDARIAFDARLNWGAWGQRAAQTISMLASESRQDRA